MRASLLPNGVRLTPRAPAKIKCIELVSPDGKRASVFGYAEDRTVSTTYPFSIADVRTQLDLAVSLGCNTVKLGDPGMGATAPAGMVANVILTIQEIIKRNLKIYLKITGSDGWVPKVPDNLASLAWWVNNTGNLLVGIDLNNEINNGAGDGAGDTGPWGKPDNITVPAQAVTDVPPWIAAARKVAVGLPLTASLYIKKREFITASQWVGFLIGAGIDFLDVHTYVNDDSANGAVGTAPLNPAGQFPDVDIGDLIRNVTPAGTRFLVGECGCSRDGQGGQAAGLRRKFINGLGALAAHPNSFGTSYFCSRDSAYNSQPVLWGIYGSTITSPDTEATGPISSWPGLL